MIVQGKIIKSVQTKKGYLHFVEVENNVVRVYSKSNGVAVGDTIKFFVPLSLSELYFAASEKGAVKNK